jgi:hypothetical protein
LVFQRLGGSFTSGSFREAPRCLSALARALSPFDADGILFGILHYITHI